MTEPIKQNFIKSYLVWTTGESYSKSSRFPLEPVPSVKEEAPPNHGQTPFQIQTRPHHDDNPAVQKRDDLNFRVADREMYAQCGMNPFFSNNKNTYADQISTMLHPVDTVKTDKTNT